MQKQQQQPRRRICGGCGHMEGIHRPACSWRGCACVEFHSMLTPREMQVLKGIAQGRSTKDIANALNLSVKTVDNQRHAMLQKCGFSSSPKAVAAAAKCGLLQPSDLPDFPHPVFSPSEQS